MQTTALQITKNVTEERKASSMKKVLSIMLMLVFAVSMSVPTLALGPAEDQALINQADAYEQYQKLLSNLYGADVSSNARPTQTDYFGGAFINDEGNLVVCVTDDYDTNSKMIETYTGNDEIILETVEYTYNYLSQEQERVWQKKDELAKRTDELDPCYIELLDSLNQSYIVQHQNKLVVVLENITDAKVALFKECISDAPFIEFEEGSYAEVALSLKSGGKIYKSNSASLSTGYPAYFKNSDGEIELGMVTAGHGYDVGDLVYSNTTPRTVIGVCVRSQLSGSADVALIQVTNSNCLILHRTEIKYFSIQKYMYAAPPEGYKICKEGARTNYTEGFILSTNATATYKIGANTVTITNLLTADALALNGDSGCIAYLYNAKNYDDNSLNDVAVHVIGSISGMRYTPEYDGDVAREENFQYCYIVKMDYALEALDCQLWPCDGEDCELDDCIHYNH